MGLLSHSIRENCQCQADVPHDSIRDDDAHTDDVLLVTGNGGALLQIQVRQRLNQVSIVQDAEIRCNRTKKN